MFVFVLLRIWYVLFSNLMLLIVDAFFRSKGLYPRLLLSARIASYWLWFEQSRAGKVECHLVLVGVPNVVRIIHSLVAFYIEVQNGVFGRWLERLAKWVLLLLVIGLAQGRAIIPLLVFVSERVLEASLHTLILVGVNRRLPVQGQIELSGLSLMRHGVQYQQFFLRKLPSLAGNGREVVYIWLFVIRVWVRQNELQRLARIIIIADIVTSRVLRRRLRYVLDEYLWMRLRIIIYLQLGASSSLFAYHEVPNVYGLPIDVIKAEFLYLNIIFDCLVLLWWRSFAWTLCPIKGRLQGLDLQLLLLRFWGRLRNRYNNGTHVRGRRQSAFVWI